MSMHLSLYEFLRLALQKPLPPIASSMCLKHLLFWTFVEFERIIQRRQLKGDLKIIARNEATNVCE